jgi:hypothetical protein
MNMMNPYLIAALAAGLSIVLLVSVYVWVDRHRSRDVARLTVLRVLFWAVILLATGRVALGGVSLLEVVCVTALLVSIFLSMRHYQSRLSRQ